jgi:eukaryotic-like serine/threonine-protein kinase
MGDRYTITERVDQGGMAEVFRGVAESLQGFKKAVAIKRILPKLSRNKKFVSMFLDEARLSLHLQHANIVHVFDIGIAESAYFIVMEYVDGANLKSIVEYFRTHGRRLPVSHTLYVMLEVCKGLAYAHNAEDPESGKPLGIVHRDISPPNILLSKMGEVKLVDFGLAKATSQIAQTDPGVVKGKFSYLSPEAASGLNVDQRADLFAVGILLWEMLTGRRLFYGETDYQTVELVRQARIPAIQPLNPDVDPDLEAVVRRALARDPRDRFQQAADLQDAIAQVLFSRGMKVTSRDIANLVRTAVAEKDTARGQKVGPQKSIIDALIQEEILKFTSLDALGGSTQPVGPLGAQSLSPEPVSNGQSPLDPGSFIDTRGWADDLESRPPVETDVEAEPEPSPPSPVPPVRKSKGITVPPPPADPEVDSLEDILEPERPKAAPPPRAAQTHEPPKPKPANRTGKSAVIGAQTAPPQRRVRALLVAAVVVIGLIGGGLAVFHEQIFGGDRTPTHNR